MMAVPAILGAGAVTLLYAIRDEAFRGPPGWLIVAGLVICFIVSYASIALCLRLFRKHSLLPFAVYLAVLGVLFVGARLVSGPAI
jgi:undecaprenyl-diphosphatase